MKRRDFLLGSAGTVPAIAAISMTAPTHRADTASAPFLAAFAAEGDKPHEVDPRINADLKAHGAIFDRRIHKIGANVYSAVGWSACNTIMIVGTDGVIIVDTGNDVAAARDVAAELHKISGKPVRAVIYTCFHVDHIGGVKGFVSEEEVKSGAVAVIAHETLLANVTTQGQTIAPILGRRTAYQFGAILESADIEGMNGGTGPLIRPGGRASFIAPTRTFATTLDVTIAGIAVQLVHVPSEAANEIAVFLPDSKILLSSEVIPAQHFPALHPLRGEAFRDPVEWYRSIDRLRGYGAAAMVPSHGLPVVGAENVEEVLRNHRDAIQFVHDQTIRHMNKGLTPNELAEVIRLPPHLAAYKPWMQEFFGSVSQSVRAIYQGYLGWFEGDPVALAPTPRVEQARREVDLMGGRNRVLAVARKAFDDGDPQWAAELATWLIRIDHEDGPARRLKAAAFRKLGYAQINATWRNWYLSAARELDGFDFAAFARANAGSFVSDDIITALPARAFVNSFAARLKAEDTFDVTMTVAFRFPDTGDAFTLRLRRGVAQVEDGLPDKTDLTLTLDKTVLTRILTGQLTMRDAILGGQVQVGGAPLTQVARFFGYFEVPSVPAALVLR